ncbi:MAG: MBL fold metallo-hydrolase [Halobacteria archaeon]
MARRPAAAFREVAPDIFQVTIPTPFPHETESQAYLIRDEIPTLVDTGTGFGASGPALAEGLRRMGLKEVRLVLNTHEHIDHAGGNLEAAPDAPIKMHPVALEAVKRQADYRMPEEMWAKMPEAMRATFETGTRQFEALARRPVELLREGEEVVLGNHTLRAIHTPGHAMGHLCFYEPKRRYLFTGDHVLGQGTPFVGIGDPISGDMGAYMAALERLLELEVDLLLPGHGPALKEARARMVETLEAKRRREGRVFDALPGEPVSLKSVSKAAYADVRGLPGGFLMSSTEAYLRKLVAEGRALRVVEGGKPRYARA